MATSSSSAWPRLGETAGTNRNRNAPDGSAVANSNFLEGSTTEVSSSTAGATLATSSHRNNLTTAMTSGAVDLASAPEQKSMAVVPSAAAEPVTIPRRNLTETFEELYIAPPSTAASTTTTTTSSTTMATSNNKSFAAPTVTVTPGLKPTDDTPTAAPNMISPTGVAELYPSAMKDDKATAAAAAGVVDTPPASKPTQNTADATKDPDDLPLPFFDLHPDLQRELSQAVINRVSFYGVIHDINKEATAMAANDELANPCGELLEETSPLVMAVNGPPATVVDHSAVTTSTMDPSLAVIDEERWLLATIETRGQDENRPIQACPPTFLQAMGERDYDLTQENPLTSLSNGSRTQLWKPSRSWWEAKSGKNPWIEPKSHNKRWRYLWPLIHYHKFLAKCIKKLKRNNVDVKLSVSPVAAFLREEVCAVSDHLASVSLFDSDQWMVCLENFHGWTDTDSEHAQANLRELVARLPLRSLAEPGDIDSPLLRSQIDEHFLRAMVAARSHLEVGGSASDSQDRRKMKLVRPGGQPPRHEAAMASQGALHACPPMYPRPNAMSPYQVPNQVGHRTRGARRPRMGYPYPHQQWYGWAGPHQHHYHFPDDASVHSSLSGDAFSDYGVYPGGPPAHHGQYFPHMYHPHGEPGGAFDAHGMTDPQHQHAAMYPMYDPYHPENAGMGWMGHPGMDPSMAYGMHPQGDMAGYYSFPSPPTSPQDAMAVTEQSQDPNTGTAENNDEAMETPYKQTPLSPFWAHLDRATLAMGLATPQTNFKSPARNQETELATADASGDVVQDTDANGTGNAQPLLLRQFHGYGAHQGYAPPSPATQFMMSPQANFAYNYGSWNGYGYSPSGNGLDGYGHVHTSPSSFNANGYRRMSSSLKHATPGRSPPARATSKAKSLETPKTRASPAPTVETIAESESQP